MGFLFLTAKANKQIKLIYRNFSSHKMTFLYVVQWAANCFFFCFMNPERQHPKRILTPEKGERVTHLQGRDH